MVSWLDRSAALWIEGQTASPGSASVAAFVAALGASRVVWACAGTLDRRPGPRPAGDLDAVRDEARALAERLAGHVNRVEEVLRAVQGKTDGTAADRTNAHRAAAEALLDAFDVTLAVLETAARAVNLIHAECVADLSTGADLAAASLESLAICVRGSLPQIGDEGYARPAKNRMVESLHEARRMRNRILQAVESRLVL